MSDKMRKTSGRGHRSQRRQWTSPPPRALKRAPRVDLQADMDELDARIFSALDAVIAEVTNRIGKSLSMSGLQLLATRSHLLSAMKSTHRSIRRLTGHSDGDLDLTVDALALTRVQLERCFLALLFEDNPKRWYARYRKNAWKAFAEKFFRSKGSLGHLEPYSQYFGSDGQGITALRAFAREMDVSEDEFQTVRNAVLGESEKDPRFKQWFIADMPTPGRSLAELADPVWKNLGELLYPYYDNLSHFSHGGMIGVMEAAILRGGHGPTVAADGFDKEQFWSSAVGETTLPLSYVAMMFVATLFGRDFLGDEKIHLAIVNGWRPYICDGLPLGVALWDEWAEKTTGCNDRA